MKVGTEEKPRVRCIISRENVGLRMFRSLVQGDGARYAG